MGDQPVSTGGVNPGADRALDASMSTGVAPSILTNPAAVAGKPRSHDAPTLDVLHGQLLALATEVEGLRRHIEHGAGPPDAERGIQAQVQALAGQVGELRDAVAAAATYSDGLDELAGQVELLTGQLAAAAGDQPHPQPAPLAWIDVDADQAPQVLTDLASWMTRVLTHYEASRSLTACWYQHPDLVQELLNLQGAWSTAYHHSDGVLLWALDWHQRHLPHLAAQADRILRSCTSGTHLAWSQPNALHTDPDQLRRYAKRWAGDHATTGHADRSAHSIVDAGERVAYFQPLDQPAPPTDGSW